MGVFMAAKTAEAVTGCGVRASEHGVVNEASCALLAVRTTAKTGNRVSVPAPRPLEAVLKSGDRLYD